MPSGPAFKSYDQNRLGLAEFEPRRNENFLHDNRGALRGTDAFDVVPPALDSLSSTTYGTVYDTPAGTTATIPLTIWNPILWWINSSSGSGTPNPMMD